MVKLKAGQVWKTRKGALTMLVQRDEYTLEDAVNRWAFANDCEADEHARSIFGNHQPAGHDDDLMELVVE